MPWIQKQISLPSYLRGFHNITRHVKEAIPELAVTSVE